MLIPLPFKWPYLVAFWAVYVWAFAPEFAVLGRPPLARRGPAEDRGSLRVILIGFNVAIVAAFASPFAVPWARLPGDPAIWFVAGLALLAAGSFLRRHCFRVLGKFFTGAVTIQEEHRLVDGGAYRWVRHPSYSAALLMVLGISLALDNWIGVLVATAVAVLVYSYRAHVEEQALLGSLGAPYAEFMATRKRFVPFVY